MKSQTLETIRLRVCNQRDFAVEFDCFSPENLAESLPVAFAEFRTDRKGKYADCYLHARNPVTAEWFAIATENGGYLGIVDPAAIDESGYQRLYDLITHGLKYDRQLERFVGDVVDSAFPSPQQPEADTEIEPETLN